jgi:hypothetical protein
MEGKGEGTPRSGRNNKKYEKKGGIKDYWIGKIKQNENVRSDEEQEEKKKKCEDWSCASVG